MIPAIIERAARAAVEVAYAYDKGLCKTNLVAWDETTFNDRLGAVEVVNLLRDHPETSSLEIYRRINKRPDAPPPTRPEHARYRLIRVAILGVLGHETEGL